MHSTQNGSANAGTTEPGIGKVILKDLIVITIASVAIFSFYFLVKAFSILASIP